MTSRYFTLSQYEEIKEFFNFPVDYIVSAVDIHGHYRDVLQVACDSDYVKAMLSPRYQVTEGYVNTFSTTASQLSGSELRDMVLRGAGLAHRAMGSQFTDTIYKLMGALVGTLVLTEAYTQVKNGFYQGEIVSTPGNGKPYNFKSYYLSVVMSQLELNFTAPYAFRMAGNVCLQLKLNLDETMALTTMVGQYIDRSSLRFVVH